MGNEWPGGSYQGTGDVHACMHIYVHIDGWMVYVGFFSGYPDVHYLPESDLRSDPPHLQGTTHQRFSIPSFTGS